MLDSSIVYKNSIDKEMKYKELVDRVLNEIASMKVIQEKAKSLCLSDFDDEGYSCLAYLTLRKPETEISKLCIEVKEILEFKEALDYINEHDYDWIRDLLTVLFELNCTTENIGLTEEGYTVGLKVIYYNEAFDQGIGKRLKRFFRRNKK